MGNEIYRICPTIQDCESKVQRLNLQQTEKMNKSLSPIQTNIEKSTTNRISKQIFVNDLNQNSFANKTLIYTQYHSKINFRSPDDISDSRIIHPLKSRKQKTSETQIQQLITPKRDDTDIEQDKEIEQLWQQATEKNQTQLGQSQRESMRLNRNQDVVYEIEELDDQKNGFGRLLDQQGFLIYEGEFFGKLKQGNGTQYFQRNDEIHLITLQTIQYHFNPMLFLSYTGEFKSDRFNGKGVLELQDGSYIYGTFKDDKPEGVCTFESLQQNICVQTIWRKGKFKRYVKTDKRYNCVRN